MKQIIIAICVMIGISFTTSATAQTTTETIKVSGNCGMCEKKIEKAATDAGAETAEWNRKTKKLTVKYDQSKTSNDAIQRKVADVGYDTEKYTADEEVYKGLHECCQYDNKRPQSKK